MVDSKKTTKDKKRVINEERVANLLSRYSPETLIRLLVEVDQAAGVNMNWKELVSKTATGISCPREYQMVWRHLAYQDPILQTQEGAEPLDDDSDLECELEADPSVSNEEATDASAYVKILIASGLLDVSSLQNGTAVEAPLKINIPNYGESSENKQKQGTNITIPVIVHKQSQPIAIPGAPDVIVPSSICGTKRKKKPWTEEEDRKLIAAVEKHGKGNWANIIKDVFNDEYTTPQLCQRWSSINRRNKSLSDNTWVQHGSQSPLQETHKAVSLALNRPVDRLKAPTSSENASVTSSVPSGQEDKRKAISSRPQMGHKVTIPNEQLKAAAVAAGARVSSVQGKSSVILPGSCLPPNYHYMLTRTANASTTTTPSLAQRPPRPPQKQPPQQQQGSFQKPTPRAYQACEVQEEADDDDSFFDVFKTDASIARKGETNHQTIDHMQI